MTACLVIALASAPSCEDAHPQKELRAELASFPAPSNFDLIRTEERGPSSCIVGDCPAAVSYYVSEEGLAATCRKVRGPSDDWAPVLLEWSGDDGAFNACLGAGRSGSRALSVSVFEADKLPAFISKPIDPSELRGYRSAVLISLSIPP
jgi:hypothetical protein